MKETRRVKPGVEGRDERDPDNTLCNIDEEAEGEGRVVMRLHRQPGATRETRGEVSGQHWVVWEEMLTINNMKTYDGITGSVNAELK